MKILMLGWELPPHISGGLGTACHGLLQGLAANGQVRTRFVLPQLGGGEDHTLAQLLAPPRAPAPSAGARPAAGSYLNTLGPVVQEFAAAMAHTDLGTFDVLHGHDWLTIPAALAIRRQATVPFVLHVHSTEYDRSCATPSAEILAIERAGMDAADVIVAVSQATRRQIVERFGQAAGKVHVVYNGIALPADADPRAAAPARPTVCFLGRMTSQKGPLLFIEAARRILQRRPDTQFIMVGDGDLMPAVRRRRAELGLESSVALTGFLGREDIAAVLARSSVLLMPSLAEPFGLVALEAIAAGVPLVLSHHAGVAEVISSALKVDPLNVPAMADAVLALLDDPARGMALAATALTEAKALNWTRAAGHLTGLYQTLLPAPGGMRLAAPATFAEAGQ